VKLGASDLRALRGSLLAALLMIGCGLAAVHFALAANGAGARLREAAQAQRNDLEGKLRRVRSEESEIRTEAVIFDALRAAGVVGEERRLEWVELIKEIGARRDLPRLRFELAAQRPIDPTAQDGYAFFASTMKLQAQLLHEEDLTRLLSDLRDRASALIQPRSCTLKRLLASELGSPAQLQAECEIDWVTLREIAGGGKQR